MSSNLVDQLDQTLERAYDLIEADRLKDARALLEPLTRTQSQNPDVWWLYAHAVEDSQTANAALRHLIDLDPKYPGAADLLKQITPETAQPPAVKRLAPAAVPVQELSESEDEFDFELDQEDIVGTSDGERGGRSRLGLLLAAIIGVIVVGLLVLVLLNALNRPSASPVTQATQQTVVQATIETTPVPILPEDITPTALIEGAETETAGVAPINFDSFYPLLEGFEVPASGIGIEPTVSFGDTLLVAVCVNSTDLAGLRDTTNAVMEILANQSALIAGNVAAIGVELRNCDDDTALRTIAVGIQDAVRFSEGSLSRDQFSALWRPQ